MPLESKQHSLLQSGTQPGTLAATLWLRFGMWSAVTVTGISWRHAGLPAPTEYNITVHKF